MSESDDELAGPWTGNYFNYFTEIEEHFQRTRGTALFLLSPLDWALIENWKSSGVPLEAVLKGIEEAFEKWRSRKVKTRQVNSLAYCAQAVMEAAKRLSGAGSTRFRDQQEGPFSAADIEHFLREGMTTIRQTNSPAYAVIAESIEQMASTAMEHLKDLEDLERRLTVLEDQMVAIARAMLPSEQLLEMRRDLDRELSPYRGKMTADQIATLERRYLDTRLLEKEGLPRLSLFYLK
jgi:hypothetical protein